MCMHGTERSNALVASAATYARYERTAKMDGPLVCHVHALRAQPRTFMASTACVREAPILKAAKPVSMLESTSKHGGVTAAAAESSSPPSACAFSPSVASEGVSPSDHLLMIDLPEIDLLEEERRFGASHTSKLMSSSPAVICPFSSMAPLTASTNKWRSKPSIGEPKPSGMSSLARLALRADALRFNVCSGAGLLVSGFDGNATGAAATEVTGTAAALSTTGCAATDSDSPG
mmetsp:Transcript_22144/g.50907  ORF Transcript_22144/g.50907 Transcript_22144/m.50907 type:complete len:233 (+) Transcript_22144:594-1292(+)